MSESFRIGVLLSSIIDSYQSSIFRGIQEAVKLRGIDLICIQEREPQWDDLAEEGSRSLMTRISSHRLDGLLILSAVMSLHVGKEGLEQYVQSLKPLPVVSLGMNLPGVSSIVVNNQSGMLQLIDHLLQHHQYKNIAYLAGPESVDEARERRAAYEQGLKKHGIPIRPSWIIPGEFAPGDGFKAVKLLFQERQEPVEALICQDDVSAIEAIHALGEIGKSVPEDVAVLGFDDIENSKYSLPGLTTIHQPLFELGFQGVDHILNQDYVGGSESLMGLDSQLILRQSCGCKAISPLGDALWENPKRQDSTESWIEKIRHFLDSEDLDLSEFFPETDRMEEAILDFLSLLGEFFQHKDDQVFAVGISRWFTRFYKRGKDSNYWINRLKPFFFKRNSSEVAINIWGQICFFILQAENQIMGLYNLRLEQLNSQASELLDLRVIGSSREKLSAQMDRNLPLLGIKKMMICLYQKDPKEVEWIYSFSLQETKPLEDRHFLSRDIYPPGHTDLQEGSLFMFPIHSEGKSIGYMLVDMGALPLEFYQDMVEKISKGLEGILLMEELNSYTAHLEEEVQRRTQQLEKANRKLKDLSYLDHLSGLRNRRFLREIIQPEAERMAQALTYRLTRNDRRAQDSQKVYALFIVDLDFFKEVNDVYGHDAGDRVIKQLSNIFSLQCRLDDFVVRLGGEEFLLVLKNFREECLLDKANDIRKKVESFPFEVGRNIRIHKTCTIGCFHFPVDTEHPDTLNFDTTMNLIDQALYFGKAHGRNQAVTVDLSLELLEQSDLEEVLDQSIDSLVEKGLVQFKSTNN